MLRSAATLLMITGCIAAMAGCARTARDAVTVSHLRLHGVRQVSQSDIRDRIATQEPVRIFGIRRPFSTPEPYDPTTFRRDLERIERFYQSRGHYAAAVQAVRVAPIGDGREVSIDVSLREGPPTRVESIWLSGCEPATRRADDPWPVPEATCARIRRRLRLRLGEVFTEDGFDADKQLIIDLLKEASFADAHVRASATVDPSGRGAYVVYVLRPGPPGRFGSVTLYEREDAPVRGDRLPSGYPTGPVHTALPIRAGDPYNRTSLADAQRRLFDLGVFGIARIVEDIHRCDSQNRCDNARNRTDMRQYVRVDLRVFLSPASTSRWRLGGGLEIAQVQSNVHGLVNFEYRNLFGQMWRWRTEVRPAVFLPLALGISVTSELRRPELLPRLSFHIPVAADFGPDPINPTLAQRIRVAPAVGVQYRFDRTLIGSAYLRGTFLEYLQIDPLLQVDPIFREQYVSQIYAYLEQQLTWDERDNPLQTRRGFYFAGLLHEGAPPSYLFLRGAIEGRGYIPLGSNVVLAIRGSAGAVIGQPSGLPLNIPGAGNLSWPVPQDLRFYSGGANSNRGYPFYRVGYTNTVPRQDCIDVNGNVLDPIACTPDQVAGYRLERDEQGNAVPDDRRVAAVGGLAMWEFSTEIRWYLGSFGFVGFFDASDVWGWQPPTMPPTRPEVIRPTDITPSTTTPSIGAIRFDPHPSAGIGIRYISPIGVIRLDLGFRLDDPSCSRYASEVAAINQQAMDSGANQFPAYYATTRPPCDFFGLQLPFPLAPSFAIGEAF